MPRTRNAAGHETYEGARLYYYRRASDGSWVVEVHLGQGRPKLFTSRHRLQDALDRARAYVREQKALVKARAGEKGDLTLQQLGDLFLRHCEERTDERFTRAIRRNTWRRYRMEWRRFCRWMDTSIRLADVTPGYLQRYIRTLLDRGYSSATALTSARFVRAMCRWAVEEGYLAADPSRKLNLPRDTRRERVLAPEEARKLLPHILSHRHAEAFLMCWWLGLRRSEALGLRWSDWDEQAGIIHVRRSVVKLPSDDGRWRPAVVDRMKTRQSQRVLPVPSPLAERLRARRRWQRNEWALKGWPWSEDELIFAVQPSRPLDPDQLTGYDWRKVLRRAGLEDSGLNLHVLRHTFATALEEQGVPRHEIAAALGHARPYIHDDHGHAPPTTTDRYVHPSVRPSLAEAMERAVERWLDGFSVNPSVTGRMRHGHMSAFTGTSAD